jgi:hypothetical protein
MKSLLIPVFLLLSTALSRSNVQAEDLLSKSGKLIFEETFEQAELASNWRVAIGDFHVEGGRFVGNEKPEDKHGAVARAQTKIQDGIVEFAFRMGEVKMFNFVFDERSFKGSHAGHICRVVVNRSMLRLQDDKEGGMRNDIFAMKDDLRKKAERDKLLEGRSIDFKMPIDPEQWHTLRVAIVGDRMQVGLNGKFVGELQSPGIDHEAKTDIGFTVLGQGALFDNFRIWDLSH